MLFFKLFYFIFSMTSLIQRHNIRERFQGRQLDEKFDLLEEANEVILENIVSVSLHLILS